MAATKKRKTNNSKRILIVGNDRTFNNVVKMRLEKNNYKAQVSLETDLSNDVVNKMRPDLLLYDLSVDENMHTSDLPINSSFTSLENVKIIYFGTKQDTQYRWQAISDGSAGFIEKPYQAEELLSQVSNALLVNE